MFNLGDEMGFRVFGAALMLSTAVVTTNAYAADLGGDCCADLEERVAELEATTARKGNRKVSLEIYGQVNTAVMFWDNGRESNAYVVDNDISSTRFGFKGKAKIDNDWGAGFNIEVETQSGDSNVVDESTDDAQTIGLRIAEWYIKSERYGKVTVGQGGFASDGAAEVDLSGTNVIAQFDDLKFGEKLNPVAFGSGAGDYDDYTRGGNFEYNRGNRVRYDTPTIAGFVASAAWGEDDAWDIALRYAGEAGGFKFAAAASYGQFSDADSLSNDNSCESPGLGGDCENAKILLGSASIIHSATGLFVTAAAAQREFDNVGTAADEENTWWAVRGGVSRKFITVGKTAFYAEYQNTENENFQGNAGEDSEIEIMGAGIVQNIDAAAMELYLSYRHAEVDDNVVGNEFNDLDVVTAGARIKF